MAITIFNSIAILCALFCVYLLNKELDEVKDIMYSQMENAHYPAIKNEFTETWVVADELREEIENLKKASEENGEN